MIDSEYRTTDTPLAAYLLQEGFNLLKIDYEKKTNGKLRATYVFENSNQELKTSIELYNRGDATINIILYEHAKSSLLDRVKRGLP